MSDIIARFYCISKCKYFGTTLTNQNCMHKEIHSRLIWRTAATIRFRIFCLPICCLKNIKINIYRTVILPIVVQMLNMVSYAKGRIQGEGVCKQGTLEPKRDEVTVGQSKSIFPIHSSM